MVDSNSGQVPDPNRITKLCLEKFSSLPKNGKPLLGKEWTVLSCVLQFNSINDKLEVVALGTGTKCLSADKRRDEEGDILNDSHAEVMARRGFLRYLFDEMELAVNTKSEVFTWMNKKFTMTSTISYHFFSTQSPCGDASIQSIIDEIEVPSKRRKLEKNGNSNFEDLRNFTGARLIGSYSDTMEQKLGEIRTKPGRGVRTVSKSCSDKIAKWNILGIQGAVIHHLLGYPIKLNSITIFGNFDESALRRACFERWLNIEDQITGVSGGFLINKPVIQSPKLDKKFDFWQTIELSPAPASLVWCKTNDRSLEVALLGKRLGITKAKQHLPSSRLLISKIEFYEKFKKIQCSIEMETKEREPLYTYKSMAVDYQNAWEKLKSLIGWPKGRS